MHKPIRHIVLMLLVTAAGIVLAEESSSPARRAQAIAPFIDEQTIVIGHADLTRVEINRLFDKLVDLVPEAKRDDQEARDILTRWHAAFRQAGFDDLYVVVSLADVPEKRPFVVVPRTERSDPSALLAQLPVPQDSPLRQSVRPFDRALVIGTARAFERFDHLEPDVRPELIQAFEAAGDSAVQVLVLPTANDRRVIEEMLPTLPAEVGGGPSTILTQGLVWAAVGVDLPPKTSLRMTVQSRDKGAAAALRAKWLESLQFLSQYEGALNTLRDFKTAAELLTPQLEGDRLVLRLSQQDGSIDALLTALVPPLERAHDEASRTWSATQLKRIGAAMHNWHDVHRSFPAIGTFDASGKPLLSWRVHLLPYLGELELYRQFHLDEPWDSDHNRNLIERMPAVFHCPASRLRQSQGLSTYRVLVGPKTVFPGRESVSFKDVTDGTSNTILAVEVDDGHPVIWTKPEGLPFDPENPARGLGGQYESGFNALFCDGSTYFFEWPGDEENLAHLLMRNDGQIALRP